jgi:glycosyltransferase involved in cell wall biosynthesis
MTARPRRRIMLLAYHFPPVGGAGAQRALKLVRQLAESGWDPVVITRTGERHERYNPIDDGLAGELPDGIEIHRLAGEPDGRSGWRNRAGRLAGAVDDRARWWSRAAADAGIRHGRGTDLVHAFLEPYETAWAAAQVASSVGVPWTADLQDPWALDELRVQVTRLHLVLERSRMRRALSSAAAVVMNTDVAAEALVRELPELGRIPVHSIPNGFDRADWPASSAERGDGKFRIVHTGTLHTAVGMAQRRSERLRRLLGGQLAPVDLLARSHVFLLEALDGLIEADPELACRLELHLAGTLSDADLEAASGREYVRPLGFLPHAATVELIRSADLLFLPMHDLPEGVAARIVPCKTYEYLASGRPVLAAVPDGDARDLLARTAGVHLCRPPDVAAMRAAVAAELDRRTPRPAVDRRDILSSYERAALGRKLIAVFETALADCAPGTTTRDERSLVVATSAT